MWQIRCPNLIKNLQLGCLAWLVGKIIANYIYFDHSITLFWLSLCVMKNRFSFSIDLYRGIYCNGINFVFTSRGLQQSSRPFNWSYSVSYFCFCLFCFVLSFWRRINSIPLYNTVMWVCHSLFYSRAGQTIKKKKYCNRASTLASVNGSIT